LNKLLAESGHKQDAKFRAYANGMLVAVRELEKRIEMNAHIRARILNEGETR